MFYFSLLAAVLLTAPAFAYLITSPGETTPWTSTGPGTITWQRVITDPVTFSIVLVNEDRSALPVNNQLLVDVVDGTNGNSISISPPTGQSFPIGHSFRVNFVKSATDVNTIYAQSSEFYIIHGPVLSASSGSATVSTATVTASGSNSISVPRTTYTAPLATISTEAPTLTPVQNDVRVHLPSPWSALITALVVILITV